MLLITCLVSLALKVCPTCSCVVCCTRVVCIMNVICQVLGDALVLICTVWFLCLTMVPLFLLWRIHKKSFWLLILGFRSSVHVLMLLMIMWCSHVMALCVSWWVTISVLSSHPVISSWSNWSCLICTLLLLVATWVERNLLLLFRNDFSGTTYTRIVKFSVVSVLFVSRINIQLKNSMVCCNHYPRLLGLLSSLLWIGWHICLLLSGGLIVFLQLLIGLVSLCNSTHVSLLILQVTLHVCFLISGFVSLVCPRKSFLIGIHVSILCSGSLWWGCCNARWLCLQLTILKLMGSLKDFIVHLNRFWDVVWLLIKLIGICCCRRFLLSAILASMLVLRFLLVKPFLVLALLCL